MTLPAGEDQMTRTVALQDISRGGCRVLGGDRAWVLGSTLRVTLRLGAGDQIRCDARVVRTGTGTGTALRFDHLNDRDSRRLDLFARSAPTGPHPHEQQQGEPRRTG